MKDKFQLRGIWTISRQDRKTGKILDSETIHNLIVDTGLERIAKLINGESSTYFRAIAVGEGTDAAASGDTELQDEVKREEADLSYEADFKAKFAKTFTFDGSYAITEAGLFDSATVSGSVMMNRLVFAAKNVTTEIQLIVSVTITAA